jgi:hypothetical protein
MARDFDEAQAEAAAAAVWTLRLVIALGFWRIVGAQ